MNTITPVTVAPVSVIATDAHVLNGRNIGFLLNLYNNLCKKLDRKGLSYWKESKAKLITKIIAIQAEVAKANTTVIKPAIAKGAYDKKRNGPKLNKKTPKAKATKVANKKPSTPRNDELSKYIASKDLTPKQARARFRRNNVKKVEGHYVLNAEVKKALA